MRVLLLPNNIGSMTAITVQAINEAGHEARGLILGGDKKQSHRDLTVVSYDKKNPFAFIKFIYWYFLFIKNVLWADVIHWNGSFSFPLLKVTLPVIKLLKKKAVVEFVGSDIRIPEVEFADNPYYKHAFNNGYEYGYENYQTSLKNQKCFANSGFNLVILPGMTQYIFKDLFKCKRLIYPRIDLTEFTPYYPNIQNAIPLIIHSPTAPIGKGTKYILKAIDKLIPKYKFDFKLIQNMSHKEALTLVKNCDIYIDQLISGHYGMAAMEAMAFGKPVISFIKDSVKNSDYTGELPIMNANPDTVEEVLESLLINANLRNLIGHESRVYMENYHNVKLVIRDLIKYYNEILNDY